MCLNNALNAPGHQPSDLVRAVSPGLPFNLTTTTTTTTTISTVTRTTTPSNQPALPMLPLACPRG